jgi:hypothetical protein
MEMTGLVGEEEDRKNNSLYRMNKKEKDVLSFSFLFILYFLKAGCIKIEY